MASVSACRPLRSIRTGVDVEEGMVTHVHRVLGGHPASLQGDPEDPRIGLLHTLDPRDHRDVEVVGHVQRLEEPLQPLLEVRDQPHGQIDPPQAIQQR